MLPHGHAKHWGTRTNKALRARALYCPATQLHCDWPAEETRPLGQLWHVAELVAPFAEEAVPAPQLSHVALPTAPTVGENVPARQL